MHCPELRPSVRKGAAALEFAVCLPVLVLIVLGSIELTNFIYLKQSLTSAAYEGAREAVRRDATDASVTTVAQSVLAARRIAGATVRVSPGTRTNTGSLLTVEVSAPSSANRILVPRIVQGLTAQGFATMMKE
jgi:Flp pilus assembly protein TadG